MRALLIHSDPDEVMDVLARAEGLDWRIASRPDGVDPALEEHRPQVVFSIKHSGFAGDCHRRALLASGLRWFHVGGSGRDHLGGEVPLGVLVTDCAGVLAPFLAERAMAALLFLSTGLDGSSTRSLERGGLRSAFGRSATGHCWSSVPVIRARRSHCARAPSECT